MIDQLNDHLLENNDAINRRNFVEHRNRTIRYGFGIVFLLVLTATVASLITKKIMESSSENSVCENDSTGILTLYYRAVWFFNHSIGHRSNANPIIEWTCAQLCDPAVLKNIANLTKAFITEACSNFASDMFSNATFKQCFKFTNDLLIAYARAGCDARLNSTLFPLSDFFPNRTTGNDTMHQLLLGIRQPNI